MQSDFNPDVLDTRTLNHNIFWKSYPGPDNPTTYRGDDVFSYMPTNPIEYPAIAHDLAYSNNGVRRLTGLVFSTKVIGADWQFVASEFAFSNDPRLDPISRFQANIMGHGLGLAATPKTAFYYLYLGAKTLGKGASNFKN